MLHGDLIILPFSLFLGFHYKVRELFDARNMVGGHLPTLRAHSLGSTFADGKYDLQRVNTVPVSEDYL